MRLPFRFRLRCIADATCASDKFRCRNGQCIKKSWQCDQEEDCSDGSDEDAKLCSKNVCTSEEFTCKSNQGACIPLGWVCDDNEDCTDGSDEANCSEYLVIVVWKGLNVFCFV